MPDVEIKLKKFDITRITGDKVVVLIGKRNTGKSHMVKNLLYYHRFTPMATVISPTERANRFYSDIIPPVFIYDDYSPAVVDNFCKRQKLIMNHVRKEERLFRSSNTDPHAILIMDDCMYDSSWTKDANIRMLFMNGRHYHVLFLITMQFPLGMPPSLRLQVDFVFILRDNIIQNRKKTFESFAGMFKTFDMFCEVMDQCTENYECLVIDISAKSNKLEDQVFWYKAEPTPNFKMCPQRFWDLAAGTDLDAEEDDGPQQLQDVNFMRSKNAPNVTVTKL